MNVKYLVVLAASVAVSSDLPTVFSTSTVNIEGVPKIRLTALTRYVGITAPYLPLVRFNNILYYYGAILQGNRDQVELFCSYHNMKLVSIQTHEESQKLFAGLQAFLEPSENVVFWTSGRKYGNNWRWDSTGRPAHYTNWEKGEPNNAGGNENCIQIRFNGRATTLQWNDVKCEADAFFICESRHQ